MKAAVIYSFGPPNVFRIEDIPVPNVYDNQVLIKVHASSINPVEYKHRKGNHKYILGKKFPITLGYDVAGEITQCGKNVLTFKSGDMVYCRTNVKYGGTYAEYAVTSEKTLALIPQNIMPEIAATVPLAAQTALQALKDTAQIKQNEKICITGAAGGVGHFAVQIANILGGEITTVCSSKHKDLINTYNPHRSIYYDKTPFPSPNIKFNVILDAAGKYSYRKLKKCLLPGGMYISLLPRPKILIHKILAFFDKKKKVRTLLMKSNGDDLQLISSWIEQNKLQPRVTKMFNLNDIAKAHAYAETKNVEAKIAIKIKN